MAYDKISIVTDEISQDLREISSFLERNNIRAVEIRTVGGERVPNIDKRIWEEIKTRARSEGWRVLGLSPGIFKGDYSDKVRIERELDEILPDTIDQAIEIGAEFIIAFGFMAPRDVGVPGYIIEALERASGLCGAAGLKLLIENEPGSFADTGERTRKLIDMFALPNLYVNWDPCNAGIFDNPDKLAHSARSLGEKIKNVHVKDGVPSANGSIYPAYSLISRGHVGWKKHLEALKEMKYDGWFGIETHFEPLIENSTELLSELRGLLEEIEFE